MHKKCRLTVSNFPVFRSTYDKLSSVNQFNAYEFDKLIICRECQCVNAVDIRGEAHPAKKEMLLSLSRELSVPPESLASKEPATALTTAFRSLRPRARFTRIFLTDLLWRNHYVYVCSRTNHEPIWACLSCFKR